MDDLLYRLRGLAACKHDDLSVADEAAELLSLMKEALEQAEGAIRMAISYTDRDQPRKRRQLAQGLGVVRKALSELEEGK